MEHFWYIEASFQESCYPVYFLALPVTFRKKAFWVRKYCNKLSFLLPAPSF